MDDVRFLLHDVERMGDAHRHGCDGAEPPRFHDGDIVEVCLLTGASWITDDHADGMSGGCLCFRQNSHMIFNAADNREVIFIDVKNFQWAN